MMFWWQNLLTALSRKKYYHDDDEDIIQNATKSQQTTEARVVTRDLEAIDESDGIRKGNTRDGSPEDATGVYLQGEVTSDDSASKGVGEKPGVHSCSGDRQKLARVLGLVDLTMLGVGATLGVGVYVLAGSVARNQAGPSVVVSFAIAAMASLFSGFCYSEFASRISKSGSAYNYTYLSIGEFAAYIIGWNLVLEYIIGTASEAKAIANQIDSLMDNAYQKTMTRWLPIHSSFLSSYPDFIAPVFVVLITGLLSWGARESTKVNNVLTFLNLGTVGVIVFSGLFRLNPANWSIKKSDIPAGYRAGSGGFAPFGLTGIVTGAAKCFFGFVGFDGIATTGEETHNPKRNIPLAIILSLLIVFVCYFSIAVVITMVIPYYEQNADAPFPAIFDRLGWPLMKWAVTTGSLVALFTAMFGAFFPLPRILFAMSRDGLLYKPFSYVSPRTQTPLISTAVSGLITAGMSAIFKLDQLVDMMSIGTLLAYIIVAVCVLLLRYSDDELRNDARRGPMSPETDFMYVETLENRYKKSSDSFPKVIPSGEQFQTESIMVNQTAINQPSQFESSELTERAHNPLFEISDDTANSNLRDLLMKRQIHPHISDHTETYSHLIDNNTNKFGKSHPVIDNSRFPKPVTSDCHFTVHRMGIVDNSNVKPIFYGVNSVDSRDNLHTDVLHRKRNVSCNLTVQCPSKFKRLLMMLFNTQNHTNVTQSSQSVSKVCIYVLVTLTIGISFLLNSATRESENIDTVVSTPPLQYEFGDSPQSNLVRQFRGRLGYSDTNPGVMGSPSIFDSNKSLPVNTNIVWPKNGQTLLEVNEGNFSTDPREKTNLDRQEGQMALKEKLSNRMEAKKSEDPPSKLATFGEFFHNHLAQTRAFVHLEQSTFWGGQASQNLKYLVYFFTGVAYLMTFVILARQGQNKSRLNFKVPFVPLLPCVSIFMNVYLMINLDVSTWVRFLVWLVIGVVVYFSYSIFHSKQKTK